MSREKFRKDLVWRVEGIVTFLQNNSNILKNYLYTNNTESQKVVTALW